MERLDFPSGQWGLTIFDLFKAHQYEQFTNLLHQNYIKVKFVSASCTGDLHPLDLSGNKQFKDGLKSKFDSWYADRVTSEFTDSKDDATHTKYR